MEILTLHSMPLFILRNKLRKKKRKNPSVVKWGGGIAGTS